jgi:CMP-N,N'-diacetyllegionaminic acid synthase
MKNNFAIIPARKGSKGIQYKNLQKVRDRQLVIRSIIHSKSLIPQENIILSTDCEQIAQEVAKFFKISSYNLKVNSLTQFGPFSIHFRAAELSTDSALISEVLFSIRNLLVELGKSVNLFCLLQPTSPFRNIDELRLIKKKIMSGNASTSLVSVCLVDDMHPARMYTLNSGGFLDSLDGFSAHRYSRRQDLPKVYIRDGGFYLIGDDLIVKKLQYSDHPNFFIRKFPWSINIDKFEDLLTARNIIDYKLGFDPNER